MVTRFDTVHERDGQQDRRTDRQTPQDVHFRLSAPAGISLVYQTQQCDIARDVKL